jgi:hypothetical protein
MKPYILLGLVSLAIISCKPSKTADKNPPALAIGGTWKLISNQIIEKGDTTIAYPVKGRGEVMLKIFNDTHFTFFKHDTKQGKVKEPVYDSGAGTYKLVGNDYTENLEFCNYREWENHDFKFKLSIHNDTLIQRGIERIDSLKVNREIIETYVRAH